MSEDEIQPTYDGATRAMLAAIAFTLVLKAADLMTEKDAGPRFWVGLGMGVLSIPFWYSFAAWKTLKTRLPWRYVQSLSKASSDFRWWLGFVALVLLMVTLSPYAEQGRIPYAWMLSIRSRVDPKEVADAVVAAVKPLVGTAPASVSAHDVAAEVIRSLPPPQQSQASGVSVAESANAIAHSLASQHSLISLQDYEGMKAQLIQLTQENERLKRISVSASDDPPTPMFGLTNAKRWKLTVALTDALTPFLQSPQRCHMIIETKPVVSSVSQFWNELSPIFQYSGWQIEGFGQPRKFFPDGVTIDVSVANGVPYQCGWQLHEFLSSLNITPINFHASQTSPSLNYCAQCVSVVVGDVSIH